MIYPVSLSVLLSTLSWCVLLLLCCYRHAGKLSVIQPLSRSHSPSPGNSRCIAVHGILDKWRQDKGISVPEQGSNSTVTLVQPKPPQVCYIMHIDATSSDDYSSRERWKCPSSMYGYLLAAECDCQTLRVGFCQPLLQAYSSLEVFSTLPQQSVLP